MNLERAAAELALESKTFHRLRTQVNQWHEQMSLAIEEWFHLIVCRDRIVWWLTPFHTFDPWFPHGSHSTVHPLGNNNPWGALLSNWFLPDTRAACTDSALISWPDGDCPPSTGMTSHSPPMAAGKRVGQLGPVSEGPPRIDAPLSPHL